MRRTDFSFDLPKSLIAQQPLKNRSDSRLLHVAADGPVRHLAFPDLAQCLRPDDLLVLNDTQVIPARVTGSKPSGGRLELLLERATGERNGLFQVRSSKPLKTGAEIVLGADAERIVARVHRRHGEFYEIEFPEPLLDWLIAHGHVPLPPYIRRAADAADRGRYQTVYARRPGAVAAPTAGLHFDSEFLDLLRGRGVRLGYITLHVGAGTFQPVRADDLSRHVMHGERIRVDTEVCEMVAATHAQGGRVVAVGTTVVRALEAAAQDGHLEPCDGETDLFVVPGYRFRVVDALLTNFHLPESTLLMLVCAFGGQDSVLAAYGEAVKQRYRFFSYGDAMLLERSGD